MDFTLRDTYLLSQPDMVPALFPPAATAALGIQAAMDCFQLPWALTFLRVGAPLLPLFPQLFENY